jgi:hypothetical protein
MKPSKADVGKAVRYWKNGWHFAELIELGRKWAKVKHPTIGRRSPTTGLRLPYRVPINLVESIQGEVKP